MIGWLDYRKEWDAAQVAFNPLRYSGGGFFYTQGKPQVFFGWEVLMAIDSIQNSLAGINEQLASGSRISRASDDPAGLAIADRMTSQINENNQLAENAGNAVDRNDVISGGLGNISDSLQRLRELAVNAGNSILSDTDRAALQQEADNIKEGIGGFAETTTYNGQGVLETAVSSLGIEGIDLTTAAGAGSALGQLDTALEKVNTAQAELGANSTSLESSINTNETAATAQAAARSRIESADIAKLASERSQQNVQLQFAIGGVRQEQESEKNMLSLLA